MMFLLLARQPFLGNHGTLKQGSSLKEGKFLFHELSWLHQGDSDGILNRADDKNLTFLRAMMYEESDMF